MTDALFLRRGDKLMPLEVQAFESEDLLQRLLAENPSLLANPSRTDRIVLIDREMGVPDAEGGGDRWSIDHVFVDADAVPVIVEVKRASNTQVRREVVAQMLEYAANIGRYWPAGRMRTSFAARAEAMGETPDATLVDALRCDDADEFWEQVAANLAAGRMRLVFVADQIPLELLRIVEFLNAHMSPTEVVAIELRQFVSGDDQVVSPRLLGETVASADRKRAPSAARSNWAMPDIREALSQVAPPAARTSLEIFDWLAANGRAVTGAASMPSVTFSTGTKDRPRLCVTLSRYESQPVHNVVINWRRMTPHLALETLAELAAELRAIPGVTPWLDGLEADSFRRYTRIPILGTLDAPGASTLFLAALLRFDERADVPEARLAA